MISKLISAARDPKYFIWRQMMRFRKFLSSYSIPTIPEPPVWQFPDGFSVHSVGKTGVMVVDNFLSSNEAEGIINSYGKRVQRSTVIGPDGNSIKDDYRTSSNSFIPVDADSLIQSVVYRATTVLGLPIEHVESFSLTRYQHGEYYKSHYDHDGSMKADRLYTVLIYLNDLNEDEGGATFFNRLNLVSHPVRGRAIIWINSDLNGRPLKESEHSALPILRQGAEKWVAQLWFRAYKFSNKVKLVKRMDKPAGLSLTNEAQLLRGLSIQND